MSTDLDLKAKQAFQWFGVRWWDEVDNYYLKELLGLGDFRMQSYEAIQRWVLAVPLAWSYVLWRKAEANWQLGRSDKQSKKTPSAPRMG